MSWKATFAKIPKDKLLHFIGGSYIGLIAQTVFLKWFSLTIAFIMAFTTVLLIAIAIELIYDKWMNKGTPEVLDVLWTVLGGLMTTAIMTTAIVTNF